MNANLPPAGWHLDPSGVADGRYWDGTAWTAAVTRSGVTVTVPIDPTHAAVPPLPGTAIQPPIIASPTTSRNERSPMAVGVAVMVAALVVLLFIAIVSSTGSDDAPSPATDPPASAPPATDPPATAPPATEPADGG